MTEEYKQERKQSMKVHQLEQLYKGNVSRLKEQMKRQEKERLEQAKQQVREEQKALYEKKLQESKHAREQELRLIQDELTRITEQAVSLKAQVDRALEET